MGVYELSPKTFGLFALSGVFSFAYNIIQFSIVHTLSPSATWVGGNFNKAALVFLTLILPFLQVHTLPGPPYIYVIWAAVIGNVVAFSLYSYLQILDKQKKNAEEQKVREVRTEGEEENGLCEGLKAQELKAQEEEQEALAEVKRKFEEQEKN